MSREAGGEETVPLAFLRPHPRTRAPRLWGSSPDGSVVVLRGGHSPPLKEPCAAPCTPEVSTRSPSATPG
jgi:hypothetical protein